MRWFKHLPNRTMDLCLFSGILNLYNKWKTYGTIPVRAILTQHPQTGYYIKYILNYLIQYKLIICCFKAGKHLLSSEGGLIMLAIRF